MEKTLLTKLSQEAPKLTRIFVRKRYVFLMDCYRYAAKAATKKWGIDIWFFETGNQQLKDVYFNNEANDAIAQLWLLKMDEDETYVEELLQEYRNIIDASKQLVKQKGTDTAANLAAFKVYWITFFENALLWFGVDSIKTKVNEELQKLLPPTTYKPFTEQIYRPTALPQSSQEPRDLLAIKDAATLHAHWQKYRHLGFHNSMNDEYLSEEHFSQQLQLLDEGDERAALKKKLRQADKERHEADELLAHTHLPALLKSKIRFIREFMYLRTEIIDYMSLVFAAYQEDFMHIASQAELSVEETLHMTYNELQVFLSQGTIDTTTIKERTKGYAYLASPVADILVTGDEAKQLTEVLIAQPTTVDHIKGQTAYPGKVQGKVRVIMPGEDISALQEGEILITAMTNPAFVPAMKKAAGIITNEGGVLCHAAIVSREFRKPCVIGTTIATDVFKTGDEILLDADQGLVKRLS